jgi:ATP synthase protein I
MDGSDNHSGKKRREFPDEIEAKERRKLKARRERGRSIWFGLGLMGTIGWAVAIPTLAGIAIGLWLDARYPVRFSWTLVFLAAGLITGCFNAYYWAKKQLTDGDEGKDDE